MVIKRILEIEEKKIQEQCNKLLRKYKIKFYHKEKGRRYSKSHSAGLPDLLIFFPSGLVCCELKKPGKKLSQAQVDWFKDLPETYPRYTIRNIEDMQKVIDDNN